MIQTNYRANQNRDIDNPKYSRDREESQVLYFLSQT